MRLDKYLPVAHSHKVNATKCISPPPPNETKYMYLVEFLT